MFYENLRIDIRRYTVYYFLLFLAWVEKILPIFHFTMLAGLLQPRFDCKHGFACE